MDARRGEEKLAGIDEILVFPVALEVMPAVAGMEAEECQIGGDLVRREGRPGLTVHRIRNEGADEPAVAENGLPRLDGDLHAVHPEPLSRVPFLHAGVHVQRGEERIEGARGGVHHVGIVEMLVVAVPLLSLDVAVLLVDLGRHGETRLLLVHGLGDDDARIVRTELEKEGAAVLHHGDELLVPHPGGVEENVVAEMADAVHHLTGVVDRTVIGAELDDRQTEGAGLLRLSGSTSAASFRR